MAAQFSGVVGLPEDLRPAMARIRLRGWFAIRLESIFTVTVNCPVPRRMIHLDGKATQEGRSFIHLPQKCYERNTESAGRALSVLSRLLIIALEWLRSKAAEIIGICAYPKSHGS
jgi:hypothetical protein